MSQASDPRLLVQSGPFKDNPQQWFTRKEVIARFISGIESLEAEVERLKGLMKDGVLSNSHTHFCRRCETYYTPLDDNEDCPVCGYDGKD